MDEKRLGPLISLITFLKQLSVNNAENIMWLKRVLMFWHEIDCVPIPALSKGFQLENMR